MKAKYIYIYYVTHVSSVTERFLRKHLDGGHGKVVTASGRDYKSGVFIFIYL